MALGCANFGALATERDAAGALSVALLVLAAGLAGGAIVLVSGGASDASLACAPALSNDFAALTCAGRF